MTLWDVDPEVSAYTWREKPVQLANSAQSYTPTFLVLMQQRQEFVEVLNERDRGHSAAAEFFEHVAFACLATGAPLRLRYENELRTEPRLTNARLMLAEAAPREGPELRLLIHEILLRSGGRTRLGDIEALLRARGLGRADLFRLLIAGFLSTDLFQPLTNASEIRYAQMEARQ